MRSFFKKLNADGGWYEFFRYAVAGVLTTLVNFGILYLLERRLFVNTNVANIISVLCSVLFAYAANKIFVFRTHCDSLRTFGLEAASFFSARFASIALDIAGVWFLNGMLNLDSMIAKLIINVFVILLNYVLSKKMIFQKGQPKQR